MTAQSEAITLPEHDTTAHAGEQIVGVSRCTDELDPSDNDLGSMHTFSAQLPDRDRMHPGRVGKITATTCSKHPNGLSGDGPLVFNQIKKGDQSDNITIANHTTKQVIQMMIVILPPGLRWSNPDW